ncbi:rhodanese-like domain-containing protein [Limnochorda pilosa]|uniref:Rhodanese domain-containing protein n=1 Tax=Limnochorda pilosa TaxID=1555112 RepID=A0A0K2SGS0_LIMPI|nr:rhodanese-like domain-containing protein [Limnochorda pilosa]BAS26222.1 hypothetical protein LIP_0365 [Limnochorda pilosa]
MQGFAVRRQMLSRLGVASFVLLLGGLLLARGASAQAFQMISAQDLRSLIDGPEAPVVLDVRLADEVSVLGKIPEATVVSLNDLMLQVSSVVPDQGATVVIYAASDATAKMAALALTQLLGYTDVRFLEGGFDAWDLSGYPVEPWEGPQAAPIPGGC